MPTNLLMWNVQFFTVNKISLDNAEWADLVDIDGEYVSSGLDTLMNLDYITNNIQLADAHIFVLIENLSSQGTMGSLANGNGAMGSRLLLEGIRGATHSPHWMLVPPLKMVSKVQVESGRGGGSILLKEGAYTECVAVFYRSDLLNFVGPYVWPLAGDNNDTTKTAQPNTNQATGPYPAVWDGTYPAGNYFAGQFEYFVNPATRQGQYLFPDIGSRRPFFTQFREIGGGRLISLVSVHFPPKEKPASQAYSTTLGYFGTSRYTIQQDEVVLVGGDFNLDYLTTAPLASDALYGGAGREGFKLALNIKDGLKKPTMLRRSWEATPKNYQTYLGLDNIAYRSGGAALNPNKAILDRVNNSDAQISSLMFTPMQEILGLPTTNDQERVFRLLQNYSYMGPVPGVSDHLGIVFQF